MTRVLVLIFALAAPAAAQPVAPWVQSLCESEFSNLIERKDCLKREQAALSAISAIEDLYGDDGRTLLESCTPAGAPSFAATAQCAEARIQAAVDEGEAAPLGDAALLDSFKSRPTDGPANTSAFGKSIGLPQLQGEKP
ncbi:hypothetical protein [Algicella marina]|uniref:Uncharacterized protein n=1 Tax=Algicella marina TaxID=2683284 RepID=A0A6P1T180_9RHOB|nr:hypothetical protein [Algicella marina]QHQ35747.1 hypothetical protein GO499_11450 [Algicella marina]